MAKKMNKFEELAIKYARENEAISLVLASIQEERDEYRDLYSATIEKLEAAEAQLRKQGGE